MLKLIAEPHGLDEMHDDWKQPAAEVYALLQQLNQGTAPENWPQKFYELGVGNFGNRWAFTRRLGVYGADLNIGSGVSILSKSYFMDGRGKAVVKKLRVPFGRREWHKSSEITEIFEILARVAYTFDWDYAASRCLQEATAQGKEMTIEPTVDWPQHVVRQGTHSML